MKKLLVVSHCILNTASKVAMDECELADEYAQRDRLMKLIIENNIQLIQLPCPEFMLYGSRRWGHVREQFNHPHYRMQTREMLEPILMQLEEYMTYEDEYKVLGIVSVEGSPSCGYHLTCSSDEWKGEIGTDSTEVERIQKTLKMTDGAGVMMEILETELKSRNLNIPIITMDEAIKRL